MLLGVSWEVTFNSQETPDDLIKRGGHLGASTGRVANRIGYGKFELGTFLNTVHASP